MIKPIFQILPTFVDIGGNNFYLPIGAVTMAELLWRKREEWISHESLRTYLACSDRSLREHGRQISEVFIGFGWACQSHRRPGAYRLSRNAPPEQPQVNGRFQTQHGLNTLLNVYDQREHDDMTPRERKIALDAFNAGRAYQESLTPCS